MPTEYCYDTASGKYEIEIEISGKLTIYIDEPLTPEQIEEPECDDAIWSTVMTAIQDEIQMNGCYGDISLYVTVEDTDPDSEDDEDE